MNTEFKLRLTPLDDRSAYGQSLPEPNTLEDVIPVDTVDTTELWLSHDNFFQEICQSIFRTNEI